jgi:hypothetical protein
LVWQYVRPLKVGNVVVLPAQTSVVGDAEGRNQPRAAESGRRLEFQGVCWFAVSVLVIFPT